MKTLIEEVTSSIETILFAYESFLVMEKEHEAAELRFKTDEKVFRELVDYLSQAIVMDAGQRETFYSQALSHHLSDGSKIGDYLSKLKWDSERNTTAGLPNYRSGICEKANPTRYKQAKKRLLAQKRHYETTFLVTVVNAVERVLDILGIRSMEPLLECVNRHFRDSHLDNVINEQKSYFNMMILERNCYVHNGAIANKKLSDYTDGISLPKKINLGDKLTINSEMAMKTVIAAIGVLSALQDISTKENVSPMQSGLSKQMSNLMIVAGSRSYSLLIFYFYVFWRISAVFEINYWGAKKGLGKLSRKEKSQVEGLLSLCEVNNNAWLRAGVYALLKKYDLVSESLLNCLETAEIDHDVLLYTLPNSPIFDDYLDSDEFRAFAEST